MSKQQEEVRVTASRFSELYNLTPEQVDVVRRVMCPTATDDELHYFFSVAKRTGLDPLTNQLWLVRRPQKVPDKMGNEIWIEVAKPMTGIDGYRVIAQRSNEYEGQGPIEWCDDSGKWTAVWLSKDYPAAARATIHRRGFKEPMVAVALWDEYVPKRRDGKPTPKWDQSPAQMLGKVVEALALRKAFPHDMSGLYVAEEMDHADAAASYAPPPAAKATTETAATAPPPVLETTEQKQKRDEILAAFATAVDGASNIEALKAIQAQHLAEYIGKKGKDKSADELLDLARPIYTKRKQYLELAKQPTNPPTTPGQP